MTTSIAESSKIPLPLDIMRSSYRTGIRDRQYDDSYRLADSTGGPDERRQQAWSRKGPTGRAFDRATAWREVALLFAQQIADRIVEGNVDEWIRTYNVQAYTAASSRAAAWSARAQALHAAERGAA